MNPILAVAASFSVALLVYARRARGPRAALPVSTGLHARYGQICDDCCANAEHWPLAKAMAAKCSLDSDRRLRPPAFEDGYGPIGAYAMLHTPKNLAVLRWCRAAFTTFVTELEQHLDDGVQREDFHRHLHFMEERSWHVVVSVFHEHPSLLPAEERHKWRDVDASLRPKLIQELRRATAGCQRPSLRLHSLCICKDGALIAGFVDDDVGSFAAVRSASAAAGERALGGELTSRPKALIHATLGRLLGAPAGMSGSQKAAFARTVRKYNRDVLPRLVACQPQVMTMDRLSLVRDSVWWMTEFELYDTWALEGPAHGQREAS
jgi:hypothetical protein